MGFGASHSFSGVMRNMARTTTINDQNSGSALKPSAGLSLSRGWHPPDGSLGSPYAGTSFPPWRQREQEEVSLLSHPIHPEKATFLPCYCNLEQNPIKLNLEAITASKHIQCGLFNEGWCPKWCLITDNLPIMYPDIFLSVYTQRY